MRKVKNKVKTHGVLVYEMTPKLANALSQLLESKRRGIKNAGNYLLFQASFEEFVRSADEICHVLEGMVVNGQNH